MNEATKAGAGIIQNTVKELPKHERAMQEFSHLDNTLDRMVNLLSRIANGDDYAGKAIRDPNPSVEECPLASFLERCPEEIAQRREHLSDMISSLEKMVF